MGDAGLLERRERKYAMSLILKTLANRRCEFSVPISQRSAHKFSIKINLVRVEKKAPRIIMGAIVFDIRGFN